MAVYDLPLYGLSECTFTLDDGTVSSGFKRGQAFNITQVVDPMFRVKIETNPLDQAGMQAWTSWKAKLRGGLNRFAAFDLTRAAPLFYRGVRSPAQISANWDGGATVKSLGVSGAVVLAGLPAGYHASEGDRISIASGDYRGLYEVTEQNVANSSGDLSVKVSPFVHSYFPIGSVATLWRPKGLFLIDWKSWGMSVRANPSAISFDGYQVLK